jgi:hypothetical protein
MDSLPVASAVARALVTTESAVDEALAQAVALMRRMISARRELGLPVATTDPVMGRVSAAVNALGDAQRELVRAHGDLARIGADLGLGDLGFGPLVKPTGGPAEPQPVD